MRDHFCICGHPYRVHIVVPYLGRKEKCVDCVQKNFATGVFDSKGFPAFHKFFDNNLDYLEWVYDNKTSSY